MEPVTKHDEDTPIHPRRLEEEYGNLDGGEHNEAPSGTVADEEDDEPSDDDDDEMSGDDEMPILEAGLDQVSDDDMSLEELAAGSRVVQEAPLPCVKMSLLVVGGAVNVFLSVTYDWCSNVVEGMEAESKEAKMTKSEEKQEPTFRVQSDNCNHESKGRSERSDDHNEEMKGGSEDGTLHGAEALNPSLLKSMEQVIFKEIQKPSCLYEPDLNMTMPCPWRGSWDTDKANPNVYMIIATRLRPKPGAASAPMRGREPRIMIQMGQMVAKHNTSTRSDSSATS